MEEERIGLYLDYENLAIGAREYMGGAEFDLRPVTDALAERGRLIVRRAYADWAHFEKDGRMLTRHHVELIDIPQKMGAVRKNAADIKLAVDAIELAFEREYITTFVIASGDSDFTPLVQKLRELNKRVIGLGIEGSTSDLVPPACDEFLFYDRLEGVERKAKRTTGAKKAPATRRGRGRGVERDARADESAVSALVTRTLAGLQRSAGAVRASALKRAILRKDPTFNEADHGYRTFGELLRTLAERGVVVLTSPDDTGDPVVALAQHGAGEDEAFELLREVVAAAEKRGGPPALAGLKNRMRKRRPDFTEKELGYGSFLQFVKAARTRGYVETEWDDSLDDYVVRAAATAPGPPAGPG